MSEISIIELIDYLQNNSKYDLEYLEDMVKNLSDFCLDDSHYHHLKDMIFGKDELPLIFFKYKKNKIIKRLFIDYINYPHQNFKLMTNLIDQHIIVSRELFRNDINQNRYAQFKILIRYCIQHNPLSDDDILYLANHSGDYINFILDGIFVWIEKNICKKNHKDTIITIIQNIFSICKKDSQHKFLGNLDEQNKGCIVSWIKENLNNKKNNTKKLIEDYLCDNNIMSPSQIIIVSKNKDILKELHNEGLLLVENCKESNFVVRLFRQVLDLGYVPEKYHFINFIYTNDILSKIISEKKVFKILQNKFQEEILENLINDPQLKKEKYDLFMKDKKYNTREIDYIFSRNKKEFLSYLFEDIKLEDDVKLNEKHFEVMIYYNMFKSIPNLINGGYIQNLKQCFNIFWIKLKQSIISSYGYYHDNQYISEKDIPYFLEIYYAFVDKENIIEQSHFDDFFQKKWFVFSDYLVKQKKIYPNSKNYEIYISNVTDESSFDFYFGKLKLSEHHLDLACLYKKKEIVQIILNQKIQPTAKCYQSLFQKEINYKVTPDIIELLIIYGYQLTDSDILVATKNRIILHDCPFTQEFVPTEEFYGLCDLKFRPGYNDNMYKDIVWLRRMCKIARIADEYKQIKKFLKTSKIKMDFMCYAYISNNYSSNKMKDELLRMFNSS